MSILSDDRRIGTDEEKVGWEQEVLREYRMEEAKYREQMSRDNLTEGRYDRDN